MKLSDYGRLKLPVRVIFYGDDDGSIPVIEWLDGVAPKVQDKVRVRIERLKLLGHELRRPEADYLIDGIYELRISCTGIQYRILYFFHGRTAVILTNGLVKKKTVPGIEIQRAIDRKRKFELDAEKHTAGDPR